MASDDFDAMIGDDSWLQDSPPRLSEPVSKPNKRAKAMNIDDLLKDHYKDKSKKLDRETKQTRTFVSDSEDSDDDEFEQKTHKEVRFEELVECCEKQVHAGGATLDILKWGERLFCGQKRKEPSACLRLGSPVVQALLIAKDKFTYESVESEKNEQTAEALVAELLASGWFLSFKFKLDCEMMYWILDTMIFTIDKDLEKAACEFLCHTLESENADCSWIPSYSAILNFFEAYGYIGPEVSNHQISKDLLDSKEHPPHNLGSFLRFLMTCLRKRHLHQSYSREDVEKLAVLIASLPLDRSLMCLGTLIQECLDVVLNSFREDEWHISRERIAISMAKVNRQVVNCLKLVRSLHSRGARMKSLQSLVALHLFAKMANEKAVSGLWDMLSVFRKTDVKKTVVDFVSLYYQMSMADIWLWSNPVLKSEKGAVEAWLHFLKSCSFQISSTDWRPYATKVRNHASYLLQVYQCYYQGDDYEET